MYKLCVFDMDGTLINTIADIGSAMNRSLAKMGYAPHTNEEYYKMVGDGMEALCRRALPEGNEEQVGQLVALYEADYLSNCCVDSAVYDGLNEVVEQVHRMGSGCAVLSNKPHEQTIEVAEKLLDCDKYFKILGQTDRFPVKPAPDSLLYIIEEFGAEKSQVVFIGDSNVDMRLGKSAGVDTIGVAWGFRGEEELLAEGADRIAHNPQELLEILKEN